MSALPAPRLSAISQGILLMMTGVFFFTLLDALAKHLTGTYPTIQVVWARYAGQTGVLLVLFAPRLRSVFRTNAPVLQISRSICQFGAAALFFASLQHMGLAEATAIMDVNPVLITLGAALMLGERLGPRRIAGIVVALIGAMIIIRPGSGVFTPASLLPLVGAVCYAGFGVLTRAVGGRDGVATSLMYAALCGMLVTSVILPFVWQPIALGDLWGFVLIGLLGCVGQMFLIRAFTIAEAGALAPFGYVGLILATLWSWLFWGHLPDLWTQVGMVVIAGAGLYVWHRETQARRAGTEEAR